MLRGKTSCVLEQKENILLPDNIKASVMATDRLLKQELQGLALTLGAAT